MVGACLAELVYVTGWYAGLVAVEGGLAACLGAVAGGLLLIGGEVINVLNAFF